VHQVGHYPELHQDARSTKHKKQWQSIQKLSLKPVMVAPFSDFQKGMALQVGAHSVTQYTYLACVISR
jgi:hypothetical protein